MKKSKLAKLRCAWSGHDGHYFSFATVPNTHNAPSAPAIQQSLLPAISGEIIPELPEDLLCLIFTHLNPQDLLSVRRCSTRWMRASLNTIWRHAQLNLSSAEVQSAAGTVRLHQSKWGYGTSRQEGERAWRCLQGDQMFPRFPVSQLVDVPVDALRLVSSSQRSQQQLTVLQVSLWNFSDDLAAIVKAAPLLRSLQMQHCEYDEDEPLLLSALDPLGELKHLQELSFQGVCFGYPVWTRKKTAQVSTALHRATSLRWLRWTECNFGIPEFCEILLRCVQLEGIELNGAYDFMEWGNSIYTALKETVAQSQTNCANLKSFLITACYLSEDEAERLAECFGKEPEGFISDD